MKNVIKQTLWMVALVAMVFTSCKEETSEKISAFDVMTTYMAANSLDLNNIIGTKGQPDFFVTKAPSDAADITSWAQGFYIMDIRASADYTKGFIPGAKNVKFTDILTEAAKAGDKPILVVCYSGQSACFATSLLRLYGYPKTKALKWGMSSWNNTCASHDFGWNNGTGDHVAGNANWKTSGAPAANQTFAYPSFSATSTDGQAILKERVEAIVAGGFKGVKGTDVLTTPANYHINNFFPETDFDAFGHFDGAYRIKPVTIVGDEIKYLNPEMPVVTYCYTGQTSAVISAFLRVVGYDAVSLKNGMNSINNSHAHWPTVKNQWGGDSNPHDYATVTE